LADVGFWVVQKKAEDVRSQWIYQQNPQWESEFADSRDKMREEDRELLEARRQRKKLDQNKM
jgi:hypothetical protein